jgi:uncharacterized protein (DUF1697 family)
VRHVAFLRNINQGQRGHPSTADILAAFAGAGARAAVTFQANGTVVFAADDPQAVVDDAVDALVAPAGVAYAGFRMPLPTLAAIVDAHAAELDVGRRELTLHRGGTLARDDPEVMRVAAHRRCEVVDAGDGWIVSVNERDHESNATPVAERLMGGPATSRGLPTLVRLIDRFAQGPSTGDQSDPSR